MGELNPMPPIKKNIKRSEFKAGKCQAYNRAGYQCKKSPAPDRKVCRYHGGLTPVGPASPHWKHGRASKHVPKDLLKNFEAAMADTELISLRMDLALLEARQLDLLDKASDNDGGDAYSWARMGEVWKDLKAADKAGDKREIELKQNIIESIIDRHLERAALWDEIYENMERKRRLSGTEAKRLIDMQMLITSDRLMVLVYKISNIIKDRVKDPKIAAAIAQDIRSNIS